MSNTLYNRTSWTTQHALSSDHLPIITTINIRHDYILQQNRRTFTNYKKADWTQFTEDTESAFAQTTIPTNIHPANRIFTNIILIADKHNIPKGKMYSNHRLLQNVHSVLTGDVNGNEGHFSLDIIQLCYRCWQTHLICQHSNRKQTDNRVLNYRPPPINDETTGHSRVTATLRPRQALELLQKRLKQTDSPSFPDCGMDLEKKSSVLHLFNCTAHSTSLTPANLRDRPVKSIRELSFLDPEKLD